MPAILSKIKLEEMIGMGLVEAELLDQFTLTYFESSRSDNKEIMVNISENIESKIEPIIVDRTIVSQETVRHLQAMGLFNAEKLENKEISYNIFPSKFDSDVNLVTFSKATEAGIQDLFTAPAKAKPAVTNDGTVDFDAPVAEAPAEMQTAASDDDLPY